MIISKLPAFRPVKRHRKLIVVLGLCGVFQAIGADTDSTYSSSMIPVFDAADNSIRHKFIKRLMPVDPESTEAMLADRGLDGLDPSKGLS